MIKAIKLLFLMLVSTLANAQTFPNSSWHYYVPVTVPSGAPVNGTLKVDVDFAALLTTLGVSGTFDTNSVRVARASGALATIQEYTDAIYAGATDATGNSRGEVRFIIEDAGPSTYYIFFDITANGSKAANPQTPINGNFEKGTAGQAQPAGWNAPTKLGAAYDAQVRPSETVTVSGKNTNGTPNSGLYSYLIGDRTTDGTANGVYATITKTINVPATNPGNLVFDYRIEGWDSAVNGGTTQWDYFNAQIISGATTTTIVGPTANNYTTYPFSPNYTTNQASNSTPGYGQYNGWDMTTGKAHKYGMTVAWGAEPWWTVTYPLTAFAGKTITLSFSTYQNTQYKTWVSLDDIEWSVYSGTLGAPSSGSVDASNFNCIETSVTYSASGRAPLYTKVTDQAFSFDVVALKSSGSIETNYVATLYPNKSVTVELFDATTPQTCSAYSSPVASATATFSSSSSGRVTIPAITMTSAAPNLVCRIKDTNPTTPVYGCSTDTFTVRPQSISSVTSSANADSTGVSSSASPKISAGTNFSLTADTGKAGYSGTPQYDNNLLEWPAAPVGVGSLTGSFTTPATSSTGNGATGNFSYSEVGYFRFKTQGIYDSSFVNNSSDATNGDCIAGSFSNTASGGKYGCNFGNTLATSYFGRFTPSYFALSSIAVIPRNDYPTCAGTYNYIGEDIKWSYTLTAKNSSGATTQNYSGSYNRATLTNTANYTLKAKSSSVLNTYLSSATGSFTNGVASATLIGGLSRSSLMNVQTTNWGMTFSDTDNVTTLLDTDLDASAGNDSSLLTTGLTSRFGMLRVGTATGNVNTTIKVPYQVLYRDSNGWRQAADDSCTTFSTSNVVLGNLNNITNSNINVNSVSSLNGGVGYINVKPQGSGQSSFEIGFQEGSSLAMCSTFTQANTSSSAGKTYLYGNHCGTTFDKDPRGRVSVGSTSKNNPIIYWQEKY